LDGLSTYLCVMVGLFVVLFHFIKKNSV